MNKKQTIPILCSLLCVILQGCAVEPKSTSNELEHQYLESWVSINYPSVQASGLGIYILEEEAGNGYAYNNEAYPIVSYNITDIEGNITSTTYEDIAKRLGTYSVSTYYGSTVWDNSESNSLIVGVADALKGMKVGGRRKVLIPSWLMVRDQYDTAEDYYLKSSSQNSSGIYDITLDAFTEDILQYQKDSIARYSAKTYGNPSPAEKDTTGFYLFPPAAQALGRSFPNDTTIRINYTGRLLDGKVFDTTVEKVAKDNGIYSSSKTYGPTTITWGEGYKKVVFGSDTSTSTPIVGFQLLLWQLQDYDSCTGIFTSDLGYGESGEGTSIPAFAPLIFEVELVK